MRVSMRTPLVRDLAAITGVVIAGMLFARIFWRDITFWGDNAESFWPLWHMWGTAIRSGEVFLFQPDGWSGANIVGEAAYEVFNPVTAIFAVGISFFDNIALAGFFVVIASLTFFGWGVYGVARAYGATNLPALLVGGAAPFAGFTLFYEAGNWISGLLSVTWVAHFWWSSKRFADRQSGPLIPFLFGALAATVGSPYAAVGVVVTLVAMGIEILTRRDVRRFWQYAATGLAVGAVVVLTYMPLLFALPHTERSGGGLLASNDNYLSPSLSDIAAASAPTYLPRMDAWYATHDLVPSAYLAWFVLPLLPVALRSVAILARVAQHLHRDWRIRPDATWSTELLVVPVAGSVHRVHLHWRVCPVRSGPLAGARDADPRPPQVGSLRRDHLAWCVCVMVFDSIQCASPGRNSRCDRRVCRDDVGLATMGLHRVDHRGPARIAWLCRSPSTTLRVV